MWIAILCIVLAFGLAYGEMERDPARWKRGMEKAAQRRMNGPSLTEQAIKLVLFMGCLAAVPIVFFALFHH